MTANESPPLGVGIDDTPSEQEMDIELLFHDGRGEYYPFTLSVPSAVHRMYGQIEAKVVVESTTAFLIMYLRWDGPVVMYHLPKSHIVLGVSQIVQMAYAFTHKI